MSKGMTFYSPIKAMTFNVRHRLVTKYHPVTGAELEVLPPIRAEFGRLGEEIDIPVPGGGTHKGAEIIGHYFNSAVAQDQNGWSDDEREMVEQHLLKKCEQLPEWITLVTETLPEPPWPTYDALSNYLEIATLADKLGLVESALEYERRTKNRDGVVSELEKRLADQHLEADLVAT